MTVDQRVEVMEGELKLLKTEVQQSLVNVRDFLVTLKTPLPIRDLDAGSESKLGVKGSLGLGQNRGGGAPNEAPPAEERPAAPPPPQVEPPRPEPVRKEPEDVTVEKSRFLGLMPRPDSKTPESKKPVSDKQRENGKEKKTMDADDVTNAEVNLLANLMRWSVAARDKIGSERLGNFLDVYGTAAQLSPGMKEVILKLSQISDAPADGNIADVWSRLLLELHGILSGNSALRPIQSADEENAAAAKAEEKAGAAAAAPAENSEHKCVRLKLIVPGNGGSEQEFDVR